MKVRPADYGERRSRLRRCLIRRRPVLYALGDSHARVLDGVPGVTCCHVGAVTMFRLGRPGELERLFRSFMSLYDDVIPHRLVRLLVRPGDSIIVFCGEIDVRVHFGRFAGDRPREHAAGLVSPFLAELSAWGRRLRCRVGVASVTPPSDVDSSPTLPVSGALPERVRWTQMLNSALADDGRVPFVDFYSAYADGRGELTSNVIDDVVHIGTRWNAAVVQAVRAAGLLDG